MYEQTQYAGDLILLRGLPGSGKSTLAEVLCKHEGEHLEVDQYFIGKYSQDYEFDAERLADYQKQCLKDCEKAMLKGRPLVVVANNFTQEWELAPYIKLSEKLQYRVFSLIVEQRHESEPIHEVSEDVVERMYDRFSIRI